MVLILLGDEKSTNEYQLPKSVMKWIALGLLLTSAVVIAISILSGVKLSDLTKLGYVTFALAAGMCASKLLVQILRFRVITLGLAGDPRPNTSGLALTRVASEFVSLSTPATSMGVFIRTAWLTGKGIDGGKALSIGYFEVLIEIYVGAGLALIAAVYAITRGAVVLGSTIFLVATILIVGYTVIFIIPALKGVKVPHFVFTLSRYLIGGPRANDLYLRAVVGSLNFSLSAREIVRRKNLPVVVKAVGLTIIEDFLVGAALWIILNASGLKIDLVSSTLAAYGVVAIAQIPVSIGGAGITELTMQSYLTTVYGFSSWAPIVLWRIATYQVLLGDNRHILRILRPQSHQRLQQDISEDRFGRNCEQGTGIYCGRSRKGGREAGDAVRRREDTQVRDCGCGGLCGHRGRSDHRSPSLLRKGEYPACEFRLASAPRVGCSFACYRRLGFLPRQRTDYSSRAEDCEGRRGEKVQEISEVPGRERNREHRHRGGAARPPGDSRALAALGHDCRSGSHLSGRVLRLNQVCLARTPD